MICFPPTLLFLKTRNRWPYSKRKKQNIRKKDFLIFAEAIGIPEKAAEKMMAKIVSLKEKYFEMCETSYIPNDMKESLVALIEERIEVFSS